MARATARIAIKRECTHPFGNKFNHLRGSSKDGPGVDSKMHELKAVGDILGQDPKSHLLALLHPDLGWLPPAPFKYPGYQQNLPGSRMGRLAKKMRVQQRHGQNDDNQKDDHSGHDLDALQSQPPNP